MWGRARRGLAADTGDYRFVAPDNGVLSVVFRETPPKRVVELTERKYARPTVSRTFEGRDRFAPAAGWLAKGIALESLGRRVYRLPACSTSPAAGARGDGDPGEVLRVDRFGNLITNIDRETFDQFARGGTIVVRVGAHDVRRVVATYAEAAPGELCALFGSTDHLEIAVNARQRRRAARTRRAGAVVMRLASASDRRGCRCAPLVRAALRWPASRIVEADLTRGILASSRHLEASPPAFAR